MNYQSILAQNIELIKQAAPDHKSTKDKVHREWASIIRNDISFMALPYQYLAVNLENFEKQSASEQSNLYKYLLVLASFSPQYNLLPKIDHMLSQYNEPICKSIEGLLDVGDFQISESNKIIHTGTLGDFISIIFELYYRHTSSESICRGKIAPYILPLCKNFNTNNTYLAHLLPYHPEAIYTTAQLLLHYIEQKNDSVLFQSICYDMLGEYAKREDFIHKNAPKIFAELFKLKQDWSSEDISFLIDKGILATFGINLASKEVQLEALTERIAILKAKELHQGVKHYKEQKQKIEANYEGIQQKKWNGAVRSIAVKKPIAKALEVASKAFAQQQQTSALTALLNDSIEFKNKPKRYSFDKNPKVVFKDFAFKLWVIEELMYKQELLKPKFDVREFAKEYDKRQIDVEHDGYNIIPEVQKYFKQLDIPLELLAQVKELGIDDGIFGGSDVYNQLWPFYDPGCGDELLPISNKAVDDLTLLPNLKKITGLELANPGKKLVKTLKEKGIELEEVDK